MDAWLLTWERVGRAVAPSRRIAAIIGRRRSARFVKDVAELLYLRGFGTVHDLAYYANRKKAFPLIRTANGGMCLGHSPFLYVRPVTGLKVARNLHRLTEKVEWREQPDHPLAAKLGFAPDRGSGRKRESIARALSVAIEEIESADA
jgi:hypothetical protein